MRPTAVEESGKQLDKKEEALKLVIEEREIFEERNEAAVVAVAVVVEALLPLLQLRLLDQRVEEKTKNHPHEFFFVILSPRNRIHEEKRVDKHKGRKKNERKSSTVGSNGLFSALAVEGII